MKVYKKPEVRIERFTLSKHIAACAYDMIDSTDRNTCSAVGDARGDEKFGVEGVVLFVDSNVNCVIKLDTKDAESYCYHNGSGVMSVFNS